MSARDYLSKSRFKTGNECPTKLFYLNKDEYPSNKEDNAFLQGLAEGGFQVGALAQVYFPGGHEVKTLEHEAALTETLKLLEQEKVVIFEAAIKYQNYFIRIDILEKNGQHFSLHEVKAKSWHPEKDSLLNKSGYVASEWEAYVADLAFQTYVLKAAFPNSKVKSYLMLANSEATATVDGLNQRFFLNKINGRSLVELAPGTDHKSVGEKILLSIPADEAVNLILNKEYQGRTFGTYIEYLAEIWRRNKFEEPQIGPQCGSCEYRVPVDNNSEKKSGFNHCWSKATGKPPEYFNQPLVFDLWNLHHTKRSSLLKKSIYLLSEITRKDLLSKSKTEDEAPGLSVIERQLQQIKLSKSPKDSPYFDKLNFSKEAKTWKWPLHFIDFETVTVAIPFTKGMHPYETIAFQFSHHQWSKNGTIEHKSEFLHTSRGQFPNFEFLRALKKSLGNDEGSVFRYATHENSVLRHIRSQLIRSQEKDRQELIEFIDTLTYAKDRQKWIHKGQRNMIDMLELVRKYYLSAKMAGSNSIKQVLPSALGESTYLQNKYSKPIYGSANGIKSHNFKNHVWISNENSDPYATLALENSPSIRDGGSASMAYTRMQFTHMDDEERAALNKALLKYCELDTFAMVMIMEYWLETSRANE